MTLLPPVRTSFPSRSLGAGIPTAGHSGATGTGGGTGDSHACAVSGSFLTVIHLLQAPGPPSSSSSKVDLGPAAPFLGAGSAEPKFRASLGMPIFFMASLVPRLENILAGVVDWWLWEDSEVLLCIALPISLAGEIE